MNPIKSGIMNDRTMMAKVFSVLDKYKLGEIYLSESQMSKIHVIFQSAIALPTIGISIEELNQRYNDFKRQELYRKIQNLYNYRAINLD